MKKKWCNVIWIEDQDHFLLDAAIKSKFPFISKIVTESSIDKAIEKIRSREFNCIFLDLYIYSANSFEITTTKIVQPMGIPFFEYLIKMDLNIPICIITGALNDKIGTVLKKIKKDCYVFSKTDPDLLNKLDVFFASAVIKNLK